MIDVLLFALTMQVRTANLSVTATVVRSCRLSAPVSAAFNGPSVSCGGDSLRPLRIHPDSTQYGPVVVIDF
jgi:hypothetical protein